MTSTPCQSAALDRIIAPWAGRIAAFAVIVETILMIAENFCGTCTNSARRCRNAVRWLMALCSGLFRPMMAKLGFLPPSASALHVLARSRSSEIRAARLPDRQKPEQRVLKGMKRVLKGMKGY